ncbi:MAG TPA: DNA recombination protein RmuC [Micromonosporaceae bacterium]|nr:DNA recombination protein RmuC [Micromonosporaceae bacterium]
MDTVAIVVICLLAGAGLGWLAARARSAPELARLKATVELQSVGEARLEHAMRALSYEATAQSQEAVARAITPLNETLRQLEHDRIDAYAELRSQLRVANEQTGQLVGALRTSHVRGRWGEHQLRRVVEAAGMLEHCDFYEQLTVTLDDSVLRPDMVVRLHGGRSVVVDAKVPLDAYLNEQFGLHAKALKSHVDILSARSYWEAFAQSPEFVVLFVPAEPFLDVALQHDPSLLEHAFTRNVVLATPSTLVALLRTVAYTWRQEALSRNAMEIHQLAKQLYGRLSTVGGHLTKLGNSLNSSVVAYNNAVGSLEQRVLVTARRLSELGISGDSIGDLTPIELAPRQPQAPELLAEEAHQDHAL